MLTLGCHVDRRALADRERPHRVDRPLVLPDAADAEVAQLAARGAVGGRGAPPEVGRADGRRDIGAGLAGGTTPRCGRRRRASGLEEHVEVGGGEERARRGLVGLGDGDAAKGGAVDDHERGLVLKPERPSRFNAEERGLLGSRHYADHPIIPLTNTIAMVNLDMVGRGASGLDVGGVGTSPGFKSMVDGLAKNFKFKFTTKPGGRGASDHTSFYNKNIPVLFFFTGLHPDYHKPSDIWEKIDAPEIESIGRMQTAAGCAFWRAEICLRIMGSNCTSMSSL